MRWWFKSAAEIREEREAAEWKAAADRWRRHNAEKKAVGCLCGQPATRVVRYGGTIGGVPSEVWTCDEHVGVVAWTGKKVDGVMSWTPSGNSPSMERALKEWRL